jgi:hypothetical protein
MSLPGTGPDRATAFNDDGVRSRAVVALAEHPPQGGPDRGHRADSKRRSQPTDLAFSSDK